jgi:galactose oxidase
MLFVLNQQKVPSVAHIIQITAKTAPQAAPEVPATSAATVPSAPVTFRLRAESLRGPEQLDQDIQQRETKPPVVVGVTPICPYGLSACWGGAYEGLKHLSGVRLVRPMPNAKDSTGFVYLKDAGLPDIEAWPNEFAKIANAVHRIRGVEISVNGLVRDLGGAAVIIQGDGPRPSMLLQPIEPGDKIQWNAANASPQPLTPDEQKAYESLEGKVKDRGGSLQATVTGPLQKSGQGYILKVRLFLIRA